MLGAGVSWHQRASPALDPAATAQTAAEPRPQPPASLPVEAPPGAFLSQVGALVVLSPQGVFCVPPLPRHPWGSFFPSLLVLWVMLETSTEPPRLNSPGLHSTVRVQVLASTFLAV